METLRILENIDLIIPVEQVVILVALIMVSAAIGRIRSGLAVTLFFILYWVFFYNREAFASCLGDSPATMMVCTISGVAIFVFSLFLFLVHMVSRD